METTLCLIVKNEEANLVECINSFKGLFDKIIVVDTGSTDTTIQKAKSLKATVFKYKWQNDFSKARNFALSKVETKWALFVDADDRIKQEDKDNLIEQLNQVYKTADIISCPYICSGNINQKYGQTGYRTRFIKTTHNYKHIYPVHEYLVTNSGNKVKLNIPFYHLKKGGDIILSMNRNIKIMEKYIKKHPTDSRILYYLAHDNFHINNYGDSIYWSKKYIESNPCNKYRLNKVLSRQGVAFMNLNKTDRAIESFIMAITATPLLIEPYLHLGDINAQIGNYTEATHFYRIAKTCKRPKNKNFFFNSGLYKYYPDYKLSYILSKQAKYKQALKHALLAQPYLENDKKFKEHIQLLKKKV